MTSRSWSPAPFGVAELAPFRDADDLLRDLFDGVAALAAREGALLAGTPPPRVTIFESRLRLSLAGTPDEEAAEEGDEAAAQDRVHDLAIVDAFAPGAEAAFGRDERRDGRRDEHKGPRTPPLFAAAMRAWKLDVTARWSLGLCLGWELLPALNDALAAVVARPTMTVDGLASLLGSSDLTTAARIARALQHLERLELVEIEASGPWFQRAVRVTEAARAIALATIAGELWPPHRQRHAAAVDAELRSALLRGGHLQLRGDAPAMLAALSAITAELGLPFLVGGGGLTGHARSLGAALRDALAAAAPVILRLDSSDDWALAARLPWPARAIVVEHAPSTTPYQLIALD